MRQIFLTALLLATALAAPAQSWTNRFHGPLARDEEPIDMAVDGNGNVIVTGYVAVDDVSVEYATIKYSAAGIPVWTNYYPGSPTEQARPVAVGVETAGNVFVTGWTGPKDSNPNAEVGDYVTIKSSGAGLPLWTNECAKLRPELFKADEFVAASLARAAPSPDVDWRRNPRERISYLDRLGAFARAVPASQDSLKAHVLYRRLAHDLGQGAPDKPRLLEYLKLPRPAAYVHPELQRQGRTRDTLVDLGRQYPTGFPPIVDDEPLVRAWLMHYFLEEDSWESYSTLIEEGYVRRLFAETKLLASLVYDLRVAFVDAQAKAKPGTVQSSPSKRFEKPEEVYGRTGGFWWKGAVK